MSYEPVVIVGAGFAGLQTALTLDRLVRGRLDMPIFLIDPSADHIYTPSLREIFNTPPRVMAIPFVSILEGTNVQFIQERVMRIDQESRHVITERRKIKFGDCVIATGSVAQQATGSNHTSDILACKTIEDVIALRSHIDSCVKQSDKTCLSHILIIGGGPTGVEFASGIANYLEGKQRALGAKKGSIHLTIAESSSMLVPQLVPEVSQRVYRYLRKRGVTIALQHDMTWRAAKALVSHQGDSLKRSVIWTNGAHAQELGRSTKGLKYDRLGRVLVDAALQVADVPGIWVAGDMAAMVDSGSTEAAVAQGRHVAHAIVARRMSKIVPAYVPRMYMQVLELDKGYGFMIRNTGYLDGPVAIWYKRFKMLGYLRTILPLTKALQFWSEGGRRIHTEGQWCAPNGALSKSQKPER